MSLVTVFRDNQFKNYLYFCQYKLIKKFDAMKKFKILVQSVMCFGLAVLSACGGSNSGASSDAPLGDVPGIFVDITEKKKALSDELRDVSDPETHQEMIKDFNEYVAESVKEAEEKGKKLIGGEILCTGVDIYPDFTVSGAKIADYRAGRESGSFIVRVMVTPKRDIIVRDSKRDCAEGEYSLKDTRLYYALMKANDFLIELGQINPFNSETYNMSFKGEYVPGQMIQAGVPCNSEGSPLYINCHTYDFTEFAKIIFLSETDYMALRKQAYGF